MKLIQKFMKKKLICADEIGPVIEFHIPKFEKDQNKKDISFKFFYSDDRNLFYNESGAIFKNLVPLITPTFITKWIRF